MLLHCKPIRITGFSLRCLLSVIGLPNIGDGPRSYIWKKIGLIMPDVVRTLLVKKLQHEMACPNITSETMRQLLV
jgi:hypothetical protein